MGIGSRCEGVGRGKNCEWGRSGGRGRAVGVRHRGGMEEKEMGTNSKEKGVR